MSEAVNWRSSTKPERKLADRRRRVIVTTLATTASVVAFALHIQAEGIAASIAVVVGVWLARYWRREPG
jgi:hypothetical protein